MKAIKIVALFILAAAVLTGMWFARDWRHRGEAASKQANAEVPADAEADGTDAAEMATMNQRLLDASGRLVALEQRFKADARAMLAPAASAGPVPVVFLLLIQGEDGTVSAEREMNMPCSPIGLQEVDGQAVRSVSWSTRRSMFIVHLRSMPVSTAARKALSNLYEANDGWKELIFFPRLEDLAREKPEKPATEKPK